MRTLAAIWTLGGILTARGGALTAQEMEDDSLAHARRVPVFVDDLTFLREAHSARQVCALSASTTACLHAQCAWCAADGGRGMCITKEDAGDLPSSAFECETAATAKQALLKIAGFFVDDAQCHAVHDEQACKAKQCAWCASAAVPSSCYTKEEAQQLPPAVFHCDATLGHVIAPSCHDQHEEHACVANHCQWCRSAAVPSACYTAEEAQGLPPGVFTCENKRKQAPGCHANHSRGQCKAQHCVWCEAGAVPSACFTEEEAGRLPPGVFQCDKKAEALPEWELKSLPSTAGAMRSLFEKWARFHGRAYASSLEKEMRLANFEENARMIAAHNTNPDASFTMALNEFADITWEEFTKLNLAAPQNCSATHHATIPQPLYTNAPPEIDWRTRGAVSPVKNQGACGSCWTFSTTGCLESHVWLKHGKMTLLSEQNLLDCAQNFDTHGCSGGLPSHAFEYVHYNGGLDTEATYPYEAKQGKCRFNTYHIGAQVDAIVNITARDEAQLHSAVGTVGPVSIAFQVASDFRFYKSGIYDSHECKSDEFDVNHAVLAVGYGTQSTSAKKYWIVKNSWGTTWGMQGYFQIARDKNMCGLATCASYPIVH